MELLLKRDIDEWRQEFLFEERARPSFSISHFPPTIYDWQFFPSFTSARLINEAVGEDIRGNLFNAKIIRSIKEFFDLVGVDFNVGHIIDQPGIEIDIEGCVYNVVIHISRDTFNNLTLKDNLLEMLEAKKTKAKLQFISDVLKIAPIEVYRNGIWFNAAITSVKPELIETNFETRLGMTITVIDEDGAATEIKDALKTTDLWHYI